MITKDYNIWKGNQTAVKQPILDRMEDFANFWLNTIEEEKWTFSYLAAPFIYNSSNLVSNNFNLECSDVLKNKFLPFIKTNLENEQSWSF